MIPLLIVNPLLIFLFPFGIQAIENYFIIFALLSPLVSFLVWDFLMKPLIERK
jgi:hypothetical protein